MSPENQAAYLEALNFNNSSEHIADRRAEDLEVATLQSRIHGPESEIETFAGQSDQAPEKFEAALHKEKQKTRGKEIKPSGFLSEGDSVEPSSGQLSEELTHLSLREEAPTVLYRLPHEHLTVADLLFPARCSSPDSTSLPWKHFVAFMTTLGFAMTSCGGSRVRFEGGIQMEHASTSGEAAQAKRSIMIHKPHPQLIYDFEKAREIGRRCTKRFGWVRASFAAEGEVV